MMVRTPDIINVSLPEPDTIAMDVAWADLRAVVFEATGFDIEHGTHFAVRVLKLKGSGDRATQAFVACPRSAADPAEMVRSGFLSLFGEMPAWSQRDFAAASAMGARPIFALPLEAAMARLN